MIIPSLLRDSPWREKWPEADRVARLLLPPFEPNDFKGHPVVQPLLARELRKSAKSYEISRQAMECAATLARTQRRRDRLYDNCEAPAPVCFFEWPTVVFDSSKPPGEFFTHGTSTEGDRSDVLITSFLMLNGETAWERIVPLTQFRANFNRPSDDVQVSRFGVIPFGSKEQEDSMVWTYQCIASIWSFLKIKGAVTETEKLTREGRKAKSWGRLYPCAVNSYSRVSLDHVAREHRNAARFSTGGPGVRYHDVRAHDHLYWTAEGWILRWVDAYYRGNPELGVIAKERRA